MAGQRALLGVGPRHRGGGSQQTEDCPQLYEALEPGHLTSNLLWVQAAVAGRRTSAARVPHQRASWSCATVSLVSPPLNVLQDGYTWPDGHTLVLAVGAPALLDSCLTAASMTSSQPGWRKFSLPCMGPVDLSSYSIGCTYHSITKTDRHHERVNGKMRLLMRIAALSVSLMAGVATTGGTVFAAYPTSHAPGPASHGNPGHGNPGHGNPGHGDPGHGNPGHDNPGHGDPAHGDHHRWEHRQGDRGGWRGPGWDHSGPGYSDWTWEQQCEWAWYNDLPWYDAYCD